jgi:predicted RNA binding protein YcfA (HicA-like mRNA interferase family)
MNSRDVIRQFEGDGCRHVRTTGDHWHFKHPVKRGFGTILHPKKDVPVGTLRSIEKQAAIKPT